MLLCKEDDTQHPIAVVCKQARWLSTVSHDVMIYEFEKQQTSYDVFLVLAMLFRFRQRVII